VSFQWDTPLVEGYRCRILRAARPRESVHSERFWGLDVPEIGAALGESRPDVALIPGWHSVTLARALWACRRARIPTLYRGDTHLGLRPTGWRGAVWGARTRRLVHLFDGHLSVGTRAREYLTGYPPSSPAVALLHDGQLVWMMERRQIESQGMDAIVRDLTTAFDQHCARETAEKA